MLEQKANTRDMLEPPRDIISYLSANMTLQPGDVIFSGAPPGVGPIVPRNALRTRISRLGEMELRVR